MKNGTSSFTGLTGLLTGAFIFAAQTQALAQLPEPLPRKPEMPAQGVLPNPPGWVPECARTQTFVEIQSVPSDEVRYDYYDWADYLTIRFQEDGKMPIARNVDTLSFAYFKTQCPEGSIYNNQIYDRHRLSEMINLKLPVAVENKEQFEKALKSMMDHFCTQDEVTWVQQKLPDYPESTAMCPSAF